MTKDRNERMTGNSASTGKFGFQPIEKRGHQPIAVSPRQTVSGGYQPTTGQTSNAPATPPNQGSSSKK